LNLSLLRQDIETTSRHGLIYTRNPDGKPRTFTPWLGDLFSFLYDPIMEKSIFPKKFGADMSLHYEVLRSALKDTHNLSVLELASGTGCAVNFLPPDNNYVGIDISPGLLARARRNFRQSGFNDVTLVVASAADLPLANLAFDLCLCIASLNFFGDPRPVLREVERVLKPAGRFLCAVPVPERNLRGSVIRGELHTVEELENMCRESGLTYRELPVQNGALLYFEAMKV